MTAVNSPVSVAELIAAGFELTAAEATALVRELCRALIREADGSSPPDPAMPASEDVWLHDTGAVSRTHHLPAFDDDPVVALGELLDTLLPQPGGRGGFRVAPALRLMVERARRRLDVPLFGSVRELCDALERFSAAAGSDSLRGVHHRFLHHDTRVAPGAPEAAAPVACVLPLLTSSCDISDLRRARRATRVPLAHIAERTRIPVSLLRELEWGYLVNWPGGTFAEMYMRAYAGEAGLDPEIVVAIVRPHLPAEKRATGAGAPDGALTPGHEPAVVSAPLGRRLLVPLSVAALLMLLALPVARWSERAAPGPATAPVRAQPTPPAAATARPVQARRPDGQSRLTPIAVSAVPAFSPSFASTESAMFFHADRRSPGAGSALMRASTAPDGSVLRVITILDDGAKNYHVRASPDGSQVAFDSDRDGERGVYVADKDGRNARRVSGGGFAAVPNWSPDGSRLAFVRAEFQRPQVWNVWVLDRASGALTRLTSHRSGQPWGASWFPDGRRVCYSREDRLYVTDIESGATRSFSSPVRGRLVRTPSVSPDGRFVVFQLYRDGAWLMHVRDGAMRRILSDPSAEEFTWSPDGRRVAFHSRRAGEWGMWVMAAGS